MYSFRYSNAKSQADKKADGRTDRLKGQNNIALCMLAHAHVQ